ncbi:MAG TPA: response regulator [Blastocatellia bacterium]|nr:response regulator [Blastocatellia bacterium]
MPESATTKRPLVLVVDDEPQILRVMRTVLPPRGYDVNVASRGEEALEQMRKSPPDIMILDLVMPGMSGLDVCRRVREFSSTPIIVLSAKGSEKDKVAALDVGADDYVTKNACYGGAPGENAGSVEETVCDQRASREPGRRGGYSFYR